MAELSRNFTAGKMNKVLDERLIPNGEYIDAMNVRMGSTELSEVGVIENTKGNVELAALKYIDGKPLSTRARCIGSYADGTNETIYWFVHDPEFTPINPTNSTGKLDLIVSYNVYTEILTYHIVSINDGNNALTTLNFNPTYLITGINLIGDLLFFTDDYNPPRCINVIKSYANPTNNIDYNGNPDILKEEILVIKKPPIESPAIEPYLAAGDENFMETRYICFAYRYRYEDGQYSATSQFSAPSFIPKAFNFSITSYLNEGMINSTNSCNISFNTGGPLVKEVDLLFKEASGNVIRVIEKLNKQEKGWGDYQTQTYQFSNNKIYTILPEAELLRLYDNVPRYAKAQTIMGNRLMYGNYVDGYDLIDLYGAPVKLEYTANLITESVDLTNIPYSLQTGSYTAGEYVSGTPISVSDSIAVLNLTGVQLKKGAAINIEFTLDHAQFTLFAPAPATTTNNVVLNFTYVLQQDFTSVYDLVTNADFQDKIGTISTIKPVYSPNPLDETSCDGITFTDQFNCAIPNSLGTYTKVFSSITSDVIQEPVKVYGSTSPASANNIYFQFPTMKFIGPTPTCTACDTIWEFYKVTNVIANYQLTGDTRSLHSNRDYEIGIVYMDDFNRATTALVSETNTVHVPCGNSELINSIQVTIPIEQIAPSWATRYKFVIKPDEENYDTIYSSIFFVNPADNLAYFLVEGENARKVEQGDRYIVKADSNGPLDKCAYATVLEKTVQAKGFVKIPNPANPNIEIEAPAGTYMKINPSSFSISNDVSTVEYIYNDVTQTEKYQCAVSKLQVSKLNGTTYEDIPVLQGSRIALSFYFERKGPYEGNAGCERRIYTYKKDFVATNNYANFYYWFIGDNIGATLDDGEEEVGGSGHCGISNVFLPALDNTPPPCDQCINYYKFVKDPSNNNLQLWISGTQTCAGRDELNKRRSKVKASITMFTTSEVFIFETEPSDALPDIWFENDLSFAIDQATGDHQGNVQNQNIALNIPAIVDTGFFNCFAFGNGAESYKIRDSITGRTFNLGNRVTAVAEEDYKASDRFSDITYSGVYNAETNLNNLNVFNAGLLNYKQLETSFGPINTLDGRETDVLVLQEDKISYVLAGKNLLSDSAGGGAIASVPEVLGTQIARVEKYGISFNPESYVHWGMDRYFTDAKRGVVLQMRGNSYSSDQLQVVSEFGMRTWFRDLFNTSFNTQKLGGYDPYMNEYVLSSNDILTPEVLSCVGCGITRTFTVTAGSSVDYCVDLGQIVGQVKIQYIVLQNTEGGSFEITSVYNGDTVTTGPVNSSGGFTITKDSQTVTNVSITTTSNEILTVQLSVSCPVPVPLSIVEIVLTNNSESGDTIHTQYRYVNDAFVSPLQSNLVTFASGTSNPLVSRYNISTGTIGNGGFPPAGSTMTLATNKFSTDNFVFNPANDKFRYYTSDDLYTNTSVDLNTLLSLSSVITPNQGGGDYNYAEFTVPPLFDFLYLIWDFRDSIPNLLCYSDETISDVCCLCNALNEECTTYIMQTDTTGTFNYLFCETGELTEITITEETLYICGKTSYIPQVVSGEVNIISAEAGCVF